MIYPVLCLVVLYPVVEKSIWVSAAYLRGPGKHDNGRLLSVGKGDWVDHIERADSLGDDGASQPPDSCVHVGGKTSRGFVCYHYRLHPAPLLGRIEGEDEIAGDAEGVLYALFLQSLEYVVRNAHRYVLNALFYHLATYSVKLTINFKDLCPSLCAEVINECFCKMRMCKVASQTRLLRLTFLRALLTLA